MYIIYSGENVLSQKYHFGIKRIVIKDATVLGWSPSKEKGIFNSFWMGASSIVSRSHIYGSWQSSWKKAGVCQLLEFLNTNYILCDQSVGHEPKLCIGAHIPMFNTFKGFKRAKTSNFLCISVFSIFMLCIEPIYMLM